MAVGVGSLARRKTIEESVAGTDEEGFRLKRELKIFDVIIFGIGIMVGAGVFVLTGQAAAEEAGPAITVSFVIAGIVAALPLCYEPGRRHMAALRNLDGTRAGRLLRLQPLP